MADLSEILDYLAIAATSAVYPLGTGFSSVAGVDCRIFCGWPLPDQLDRDMAGQMFAGSPPRVVPRPGGVVANVSVYALPGTGIKVYQIQNHTKVITPPAYGLSVSISDNTITVSGQPVAGEYLTLLCDDSVVLSQTGTTTAALLVALAAEAQTAYPAGVVVTDTTLTIPVTNGLVVRHGGVALMGRVTHRQRHPIQVSVWAPTHMIRASLADALDVKFKKNIVFTLPDTSQATLIYNRTYVHDEKQTSTIYRRDLIYDVEYATLEKFNGYVVTSANVSLANQDESAIASVVTSGITQALTN